MMTSDNADIAIRVNKLSKCYHVYEHPQDRLKQSLSFGRKQYYREFWALREMSFEVRKGETVGIIGRNGSGKSTLLQIIAGTLTPTSGSVELNGRIAALLELGSGFNPDFTGRENVFMNGAILGLSEHEIAARFAEIADFADIGDFMDRPVKTYSSGMILRLAFAVSVCVAPDIIIIDEALAVGDMAFQFKCMKRLEKLTQSGVTLFFVSHDINAVKAFCQRAIYLAKGEQKGSGSANDMVEMYLLDMRKEQQLAFQAAPNLAFVPKTAIGNSPQSVAFGTEQGKILRAVFNASQTGQYIFSTGEMVEIFVEYEISTSLERPSISLFVTDMRMIDLAGQFHWLAKPVSENSETHLGSLLISFPAKFNAGGYFITLRLENRPLANDFIPIDKQVGALSFHIQRQAQDRFLGLMDLDIQYRDT